MDEHNSKSFRNQTMASASQRHKGDNHLYFEVHDRVVKDSGTDMNNTSYQSADVRDQSVQQGNGQVRRTKPKQGSSGSRPTNTKHNAYSNAYISPYIQEAEYRARERTRQHMEDAKKKRPKQEWNSETSPRGNLFDPTLQKQEIFKLGPRKVASDASRNANNNNQAVLTDHSHTGTKHGDDDEVRVGKVDPSMRPKMTMRASAESFAPLRRRSVLGNSGSVSNSRSIERMRTSTNGYPSINPRGASQTTSGTSPRQSLAADSMHQALHPGGGRTTTTGGTTYANSGTAVTRSTSPISSQVVESILQEDGIVNDDDYTIHFKSFQKQPGVPNHHLTLNGTAAYIPGESAPVRNEAYYTEVLRHRLRDILLDRNDEEAPEDRYGRPSVEYEVTDCEELNTSEKRGRRRSRSHGNRNNYAERKYLRSKSPFFGSGHSRSGSRGRSCERTCGGGATEDLMNSMAQIMSAVGSIVTKQNKNPFKAMMRKEQRRLQRQERRQGRSSDPAYTSHAGDDYCRSPSAAGRKQRPNTAPAPVSYTIGLDGSMAQQVPSASAFAKRPSNKENMFLQEVPRSKTHMLNVIMAKLEAIERSEQQIQEFLQSTNNNTGGEEHQAHRFTESDFGGEARGTEADEVDRHLHGVRPLEASFLAVSDNAHKNNSAPLEAVLEAGQQFTEQSSMLAHIDSDESDPDTQNNDLTKQKKTKSTAEHGTQDSPHTLSHLQQHLRHVQAVAARGPSLESMQQQEDRQRAQSEGLSATQLRDKEIAYMKTLPKLPHNEARNEDIFAYMRELDHCRELKDVAFRSRGVTMAQVADRMTEEICEQLLASVAGELDHYIDDYSEKFLDKI